MMKPLKRRYVYQETHEEVMSWAKSRGIRAPNGKDNFPFFLEAYLKELKGGVCNEIH
jgi:hypothetical protein